MSEYAPKSFSVTATTEPCLPPPINKSLPSTHSNANEVQKNTAAETLIYYHSCFQKHNMGKGHSEQPARTRVISNVLRKSVFEKSRAGWREPRKATDEELIRFHTAEYVKKMHGIFDLAESSGEPQAIDGDTTAMKDTREAALRAAGAVCQAVEEVMNGRAKNAFCTVRPPGHHAEPDKCMGFCFFNNVGVGVQHARKLFDIKKVAVVDFDVHHGNGTQQGFRADSDVLFVSTHEGEEDFYPGTGSAKDTGVNRNVLNLPMKVGEGSSVFRRLFSSLAIPALEAFAPDMIFISAGFDAHDLDPLADIELQDEDYEWVTQQLTGLAARYCKGRIVSVLEGGYSLQALATAPLKHVKVLVDAKTTGSLLVSVSQSADATAVGAAAYAAVVAATARVAAVSGTISADEDLADALDRQHLGNESVNPIKRQKVGNELEDALERARLRNELAEASLQGALTALAIDGTAATATAPAACNTKSTKNT